MDFQCYMLNSYHFFVISLYPTGIPEPLVSRQTGAFQNSAPISLFLETFIATFDNNNMETVIWELCLPNLFVAGSTMGSNKEW